MDGFVAGIILFHIFIHIDSPEDTFGAGRRSVMDAVLEQVCALFNYPGRATAAEPYGTGHINSTYAVTVDCGGRPVRYILQRLNTSIFTEPEKLMENFQTVTAHISEKIAAVPSADRRCTLQTVFSRDGKPYVKEAGGFYRSYLFVENARSIDVVSSPEQAYAAALAFGSFQADLADLSVRLNETIPDFHHTPKRLAALESAAAADTAGRLKKVRPELDFILSRAAECGRLIDLQRAGQIIERVTHNDTKINNVLLDDTTGKGCCVIDLDTTMPGLPHYDFGDMVRTATSPAAEDETDLTKVTMRFDFFEALLRGYLRGAGRFLNRTERGLLPFSGKLITMEIGMRFLTDYLQGDVYFKTSRPDHNLDRCRTQLKLVESIERQFDAMRRLNDSV